ncbi:MAG: glycosyltransferase [Rhodobacteraceae bacterium PARR1]|nr:MAG: glycosyltransferase [Rhodobacteraceae bacterium PARR1]
MPTAAIIIPHYEDAARLARCLTALAPQLAAHVGEIEVVVVDNGSRPGFADGLPALPGLRLLLEPRKGAAEARNRGITETTAERLFFLDCDCVPAPDWLDTALALSDSADLVGGQVVVFDETPGPRSGAQAFEAVFAFDNRAYVQAKGFSVTANLLARREVYRRIGGFHAGLSEDKDWCHRATAAGFRLTYEDGMQVSHPSRGDWDALARKWRRLTVETFGLRPITSRSRLIWALRAGVVAASILPHGVRVLTAATLTGTEKGRGLATLARLRLTRAGWMLRQALTGRAGL